jgi:peptidoglycan/xylan/chitin deacetylase (PgdA/CDA1 family)
MSLRSRASKVRAGFLGSFHRRTATLGNKGPIISFTFDDFPRTALTAGGAILERYGARGTYYVALGLMNTSGELGDLFSEADLQALRERGHEIGSHTFRHSSCRANSLADFRGDVTRGIDALEEFAGCDTPDFAYPFGELSLGSKKALAPFVRSARSILPGINGPEVELNLLRANAVYGGSEAAPVLCRLIAENTQKQGWLILYTHDVQANPSPYGCTPELFEGIVSAAAEGGARILPVGKVVGELLGNSSREEELGYYARTANGLRG